MRWSPCIAAVAFFCVSIPLYSEADKADELRKTGNDAALAGDCATAVKALRELQKLRPKERISRILLRECERQMKDEAAEAYAVEKGPRKGFRPAALATSYGSFGGGINLGWVEPDPAKLAWGLSLSGWYAEFQLSEQMLNGNRALSGESFAGYAQVEWMPGHGRGIRNKAFFYLATGPGFIQSHRNEIRSDHASGPTLTSSASYLDYTARLVTSVGGGFSSKYSVDLVAGVNFNFAGGGPWLIYSAGTLAPTEPFIRLGYLF